MYLSAGKMKSLMLKVLGLILVLGTTAAAAENENRNASRQLRLADTMYDNPPPCSSSVEPMICIGCRTYKICAGPTDTDGVSDLCPIDKPYCNIADGSCSDTPDNSVLQCDDTDPDPPTPPASFKCTGVGTYPDPFFCDKYYTCTMAGSNGQSNDCPAGKRFNVKTKDCQTDASGCKVIDCSATEYAYNEYPISSQYFYYCKADPTSVQMFACEDGEQFDTCTEQCMFVCVKEGLFAKPRDSKKYYQCYKEKEALKVVERSCALSSQEFDKTIGQCIYPGK